MAQTHHRVFALVMAIVFLGTVLISGLAVLWQILDDRNQQEEISQLTEEQEDLLEGKQLEGFTPKNNVSELEIIDISEGDGEVAKTGATVTAHYTGALAQTGIIFQSSHDFGDPIEFGLDQVIKGWGQGVPGMKVGGKRRLIIPADLAYGEGGSPPAIGPNEPLVFDIELTAVKNP